MKPPNLPQQARLCITVNFINMSEEAIVLEMALVALQMPTHIFFYLNLYWWYYTTFDSVETF